MSAKARTPPGYHSVQPSLIFDGYREALEFYKRSFSVQEQLNAFAPTHFGGSPISLMMYVADCDRSYQQALDAGAPRNIACERRSSSRYGREPANYLANRMNCRANPIPVL